MRLLLPVSWGATLLAGAVGLSMFVGVWLEAGFASALIVCGGVALFVALIRAIDHWGKGDEQHAAPAGQRSGSELHPTSAGGGSQEDPPPDATIAEIRARAQLAREVASLRSGAVARRLLEMARDLEAQADALERGTVPDHLIGRPDLP